MRTRFAPSPTGYLHLGHVAAARTAINFARAHNGECYLRIEDTDHTRCKPTYTQSIHEGLDWLGLHFDGPAPRVQSTYDAAKAFGKHWREDTIETVQKASQLSAPSLPFAVRLDLKKSCATLMQSALIFEETGPLHKGAYNAAEMLPRIDPIIARKDIGCSYMVAGPYDDALQDMTHIVRGADLFSETPLQILLQALMDWPRPIYHHHDLIIGQDGKKLSKRHFAVSITSMRDAGVSVTDLLERATL